MTRLSNMTLSNRKDYNPEHLTPYEDQDARDQLKRLSIRIASPKIIRKWGRRRSPLGETIGQVLNGKTLNYKTLKPETGGLFCQRIFGPVNDFQCACGKKSYDTVCPICGVEFISSQSRRHKMGWIELALPVTHLWYLKGSISYISILLNLRKKDLESIAYCSKTLSSSTKSYLHKLNEKNLYRLFATNNCHLPYDKNWSPGQRGTLFQSNWIRFISAKSNFSHLSSIDSPQVSSSMWRNLNLSKKQYNCLVTSEKNLGLRPQFSTNNSKPVQKVINSEVKQAKFKTNRRFCHSLNHFKKFYYSQINLEPKISDVKGLGLKRNQPLDNNSNCTFKLIGSHVVPDSSFQHGNSWFTWNQMPLKSTFLLPLKKQNGFMRCLNRRLETDWARNKSNLLKKQNGFKCTANLFFISPRFSFLQHHCKQLTIKPLINFKGQTFRFNRNIGPKKAKNSVQILHHIKKPTNSLLSYQTNLKTDCFVNSPEQNCFVINLFQHVLLDDRCLNKSQNQSVWFNKHNIDKKTSQRSKVIRTLTGLTYPPHTLQLRKLRLDPLINIFRPKQNFSGTIFRQSYKVWIETRKNMEPVFDKDTSVSSNLPYPNYETFFEQVRLKNRQFSYCKKLRQNPLGTELQLQILSTTSPSYRKALIVSIAKHWVKKSVALTYEKEKFNFSELRIVFHLGLSVWILDQELLTDLTGYLGVYCLLHQLNLASKVDQFKNSSILSFFNLDFNWQSPFMSQSFNQFEMVSAKPHVSISKKKSIIIEKSTGYKQRFSLKNKIEFFTNDRMPKTFKVVPCASNEHVSNGEKDQNFLSNSHFQQPENSYRKLPRACHKIVPANNFRLPRQQMTLNDSPNYEKPKLDNFIFHLEKYFTHLSKKGNLVNNYYVIPRTFIWKSEPDWKLFLSYMTANPKDCDMILPSYLKRSICFDSPLTGSGAISDLLRLFTNGETSLKTKPVTFRNPIIKQNLDQIHQHIKQLDLKINLDEEFFKYLGFLDPDPSDPGYSEYSRKLQERLRQLIKRRSLRIQYFRRIKFLISFEYWHNKPHWMVLKVLPVLPPDLRPILALDSKQIAVSDLNKLYQTVMFRNQRIKKLSANSMCSSDTSLTFSEQMLYSQRLLQEAVDALIENGKGNTSPITASNNRSLKSLADMIKGKTGRFRQNLLGKRVDYSGRSVIVVGPKLKIHQCGLPKEMALELFQSFLIRQLLIKKLTKTFLGAKIWIKKHPVMVTKMLRQVVKHRPILLNRAPTLHRLGIQAFQPKLISGKAILLHPLVCAAFNADFDGDQMAVHVPLSHEACAEAWKLMVSRNHLLSTATGQPNMVPTQDMVLGCYYLTVTNIKNLLGANHYFADLDDVILAYTQNKIEIHTYIWVRYNCMISNNDHLPLKRFVLNDQTRITHYGNLQIRTDQNNQIIVKYVKTTTGRVILNYTVQKSLNFL